MIPEARDGESASAQQRMRLIPFLRVAWRLGQAWERLFVVLFLSLVLLVVLVVWMIWEVHLHLMPPDIFISFAFAGGGLGAYYGGMFDPLIGVDTAIECLRRGWFSPAQSAYLREWVRYVEKFGRRRRFPGVVLRGILNWSVYYGLVALSIGFTLRFYPVLDVATPYVFLAVDAPIAVAMFVITGWSNRRIFLVAERKGFQLDRLYRASRQRGRDSADRP